MKRRFPHRVRVYGDSAWLVEWDVDDDFPALCREIVSFMNCLSKHVHKAELIQGISSVVVCYWGNQTEKSRQFNKIENVLNSPYPLLTLTGKEHRIPVCYHPVAGIDMESVCRQTGLTMEEVISLHSANCYTVLMIGFLPGFPYLSGLNSNLCIPRKALPADTPEGSVAIADSFTGIYPGRSPGGWHVIGHTPKRIFDHKLAQSPCLFSPLDTVRFYPVSDEEWKDLQNQRK